MSNNKSRHLARRTGSHLVGLPFRAERGFEDVEEHRFFIKRVTGQNSTEAAITRFEFILKRYKLNTDLVETISRNSGLSKEELRKSLDFYARLYTSPDELWALFGKKQW
jgi:hypothetical protein